MRTKEDRKQESIGLLKALQAINPSFGQKALSEELGTAQGHVSHSLAPKSPVQFSKHLCALARSRIQDRIAQIMGDGYSYKDVVAVAGWFIRLHAEPDFMWIKDAEAEDKAYHIARRIFDSGYWIG